MQSYHSQSSCAVGSAFMCLFEAVFFFVTVFVLINIITCSLHAIYIFDTINNIWIDFIIIQLNSDGSSHQAINFISCIFKSIILAVYQKSISYQQP